MPAQGCHPVAAHKKLHIPDWYVSSLMLDRALDAILRRVGKLDRTHDIPYLAGYSQDGKTIYIDRHLPRKMAYKGRKIEVDRYLIMHEEVEKTLIDQLGLRGTRFGSAEVSAKHANFIQADDGGSADDVYALMELVQRKVAEGTGHLLRSEIRLLGYPPIGSAD